jgi:threonine 3-dehydrogenase
MLALQKIAPGVAGIAVGDVAVPKPGPGEVRIRVEAAGICGTDLHIYNWAPLAHTMTLPVVLGHEMAGVVDAVGPGAMRVEPGDRVCVESHLPCGSCYACLMERAEVCERTRYPGIHFDGGFARYCVVPEKIVWVTDPAIPFDIAVLFEPFGIAVHASLAGTGVSGATVVISGCGPIGLMNVAAAKALGAHRVIATDVRAHRLEAAAAMGADVLVQAADDDAAGQLRRASRGHGPDVVIDYSGAAVALDRAIDVVANGGEVRLLAAPSAPVALALDRVLHKGVTLRGLHGRKLFSTWVHASNLIRDGRVDLRPVISHVLPLEESIEGFAAALDGRSLKVLLLPS